MTDTAYTQPEPFLDVLVHQVRDLPGLVGLSIGYELGRWRRSAFAEHLMEWLPEFALTHDELERLTAGNIIRLVRRAANAVYSTDKYRKRGEFGELLLHAAVRQVFDTIPAVSKIYYKTGSNETVKGFDAVHVVDSETELELWLGEAKFYQDINPAINAVVEEINEHTKADYLRSEFGLITSKISDDWPHAERLKKLLDPNTSLDAVFDKASVPVLLTYESDTAEKFEKDCEEYRHACSL